MVDRVKGLKPELYRLPFREVEALVRRKVPIQQPGSNQSVSTDITEAAERLLDEGIDVKEMLRGLAIARKHRIDAGRVGPVEAAAGVCLIRTGGNRYRETRLVNDDRSRLPAADQRVQEGILDIHLATLADRQIVQYGIHQPVCGVEAG